jgi:hypothetical protein
MRILFNADVLDDEASWRYLDRILTRIADGAHDWEFADVDIVDASQWARTLKHYEREVFEKAAKEASYPYTGIFRRKVEVCAQPQQGVKPDQLLPKQAASFVQQPLAVIMENKFTDGKLLDIALEFLAPPTLWRLHQDADCRLIEYIGAGGVGEINKTVKERITNAKALNLPVRLIVFADSDGHFPSDMHSNAKAVYDASSLVGVPFCILGKRTIENYIPNEVFRAYIDLPENSVRREKIDVLLKMTVQQRDFFAIKNGFGKQKSVAHDPNLYAAMFPAEKVLWETGLGDQLIDWLETHKTALSPKALIDRDQDGDLLCIIKLILDEL